MKDRTRSHNQYGWLAILSGLCLMTQGAWAQWDFEVGAQDRYFVQDAAYGESDNYASLSGRASYSREWNDGADLLDFEAFYRWADQDEERTHGDIQDLAWLHVAEGWELRSGIRTVFWGVTEFNHLVDIVNQVDAVERNDRESRLGQPMINLSVPTEWGIFDVFALIGFRERTFPGVDGRPRLPWEVDTDAVEYESGDEDKHVDVAARWTQTLGALEYSLSYFGGTSRDPEIKLRWSDFNLIPYYPQIEQVGLEAQYVHDLWLWKLEAFSRSGVGDKRYAASAFGFEYTFEGVWDTVWDISLIMEYNWDQRGDESSSYLNQDVAIGTRWALNDEASTEVVAGIIYDPEISERVFSIEAHRRLGDVWKLNVETLFFSSKPPPTPALWQLDHLYEIYLLAPNSHDDYVQVELMYYF